MGKGTVTYEHCVTETGTRPKLINGQWTMEIESYDSVVRYYYQYIRRNDGLKDFTTGQRTEHINWIDSVSS